MRACGWSAAGERAPLFTATMAAKFSSQAPTLNSSRRTPICFIKSRTVHRSYRLCSSALHSHGSRNAGMTSSDLVEKEYADLNLKNLYGDGQVGHVRIRQHVNPLSSSFSIPVEAPDWDDVFNDSKLPVMVDIGSAGPTLSVLGERTFSQKHPFLSCNATISVERLVSSYPGPLVFVTILCPDPHFKKRHHKRRVLRKPLVDSILNNLITGGQVLLQSDVLQVAMDMRDQFDQRADVLKHIDAIDDNFSCDEHGWLLYNPLGIRTEREIHAELEGAKIFRRMYQKL